MRWRYYCDMRYGDLDSLKRWLAGYYPESHNIDAPKNGANLKIEDVPHDLFSISKINGRLRTTVHYFKQKKTEWVVVVFKISEVKKDVIIAG